jgi:hypothetical protein
MSRKPPASRAKAIHNFQRAHHLTYGKPSGSTVWKISVSKDPRKWRYESSFNASLGCNTLPLTHTTVTACIGWHWAEAGTFPETEAPWAEAIAARQILVLGAVDIQAPSPADTALLLSCVEPAGIYRGRFSIRTFLALGNHSLLCKPETDGDVIPAGTPANQLIEHIRMASITRLEGADPFSSKKFTWVFADELDHYVRK